MTGVPASIHRRFRFPRIAALLALIAQVVAVGIAPTAEAIASQSAPAHVENAGTHMHHSHNPSDCPACTALQLGATGLPGRTAPPRLLSVRSVAPRTARYLVVTPARRIEPHAPRAPPPVRLASL